jgi:hypothetical protein
MEKYQLFSAHLTKTRFFLKKIDVLLVNDK